MSENIEENKMKIQILDGLLEGTKEGYIKWTLSNSCFNKDTSHNMLYNSDDNETIFTINVILKSDLSNVDNDTAFLYIKNNNLTNKQLQLSSHRLKIVKELQILIFDKFIKTNIRKRPNDGKILNIINKSINKQYNREKKIDEIIECKEIISNYQQTLMKNVKKKRNIGYFNFPILL